MDVGFPEFLEEVDFAQSFPIPISNDLGLSLAPVDHLIRSPSDFVSNFYQLLEKLR